MLRRESKLGRAGQRCGGWSYGQAMLFYLEKSAEAPPTGELEQPVDISGAFRPEGTAGAKAR